MTCLWKTIFTYIAKHTKFTSETKWQELAPSFRNLIPVEPVRKRNFLDYFISAIHVTNEVPQLILLDEYVDMAPLTGSALTMNSENVHRFIANPILANDNE